VPLAHGIDSGMVSIIHSRLGSIVAHQPSVFRLHSAAAKKKKKTFTKRSIRSPKWKPRHRRIYRPILLQCCCCGWNFTAMMDMLKELVRPDDVCPPCLANSHKQPRRAATKTNRLCWLTHVIRSASSPLITLQHTAARVRTASTCVGYTAAHKIVPLFGL